MNTESLVWGLFATLGVTTILGPWVVDTFIRKRPIEQYHPYNTSWDGLLCTVCNKCTINWRHWEMRLVPHEYKAHIRKDIDTTTKFCDFCNKDKYHVSHTNTHRGLFGTVRHDTFVQEASKRVPFIQYRIKELENWHTKFRVDHPEFEDLARNEVFPELYPEVGPLAGLSQDEIDYRLSMGL